MAKLQRVSQRLMVLAGSRGFDWAVAVGLGVMTWVAFHRFGNRFDAAPLRSAFLGLAGLCGTFAGFLSASLLFSAGVDNRVMKRVRRAHGSELNNTLLSGTYALYVCAVAALGASLAPATLGGLGVCASVLSLATLKLTRVGAVLRGVLATVNDSASDADSLT